MTATPPRNPQIEILDLVRQIPELSHISRKLEVTYQAMQEFQSDLQSGHQTSDAAEGDAPRTLAPVPAEVKQARTEAHFPRSRPKRYDWALAANLLAKGYTPGEVAQRLGCTRQAVYKALKRSAGFRDGIDRLRTRQQAETEAYVEGLRQDVAEKLAELALAGNVSALRYLADRLDIMRIRYTTAEKL